MYDIRNKRKTIRINFVFFCLILIYFVVLGRLYYIQIIKGENYRAWAQGLQVFSKEPPTKRGEIFFKDGQPLAINKNFFYLYSSPPNIKDTQKTAETLSKILDLDKSETLEKLRKDSLYSPIKGKLSDEEVSAVKSNPLPGIYLEEKSQRYYPQNGLASQVVGFVDDDYQGRYGIEEYYNDELSAGKDLILNLDYNIQFKAEELITKARETLNAQEAEALIINPRNGNVLALAQSPNFDPNNYKDYAKDEKKFKLFKNDSCQELFEPGSVFKGVTMASALNEGSVTPETKYLDAGIVQIGGLTIYNYSQRSYGEQTMTNVLEKSINTGAVFAQRQLGNKKFEEYIEKFGFFEPTGIDIPETYSQNLEFKKGYEINYATAAFGQGIELTSMQLVRAYAALANGGFLVQPSIVGSIRKPLNNNKHRKAVAKETSETISKMLMSVVENGYSKKAKIPGYTIAGKTGTAQMSWSVYGIDKKGYSEKTMQSFIGFFPVFNPKFLILIKLKAPETNTAEYSAMPIFRELAGQIIYLYQVPPDKQPEPEVFSQTQTTQTANQ